MSLLDNIVQSKAVSMYLPYSHTVVSCCGSANHDHLSRKSMIQKTIRGVETDRTAALLMNIFIRLRGSTALRYSWQIVCAPMCTVRAASILMLLLAVYAYTRPYICFSTRVATNKNLPSLEGSSPPPSRPTKRFIRYRLTIISTNGCLWDHE